MSRARIQPSNAGRISPAVPTEVFDSYWRFAVERHAIFTKRLQGLPAPWTSDPILQQFKFTNAYRVLDRTTQFLLSDVVPGDESPDELFFRVILFKFFNRIETWEMLRRELGEVSYATFSVRKYSRVLEAGISAGPIYSAAYIMPSGSTIFKVRRKHEANLLLLESMMRDEVPQRLAEARTMREGFELLRSYPLIGDFLAYQYITDLNYTSLTDFTEMEFVVAGPGAVDGISKCFSSLGGLNSAELIRLVTDVQDEQFARLGLNFAGLLGRRLQLIDCQNLFCEIGKYARIAHPEIPGVLGRVKIKQKLNAKDTLPALVLPSKWKLQNKPKGSVRNS